MIWQPTARIWAGDEVKIDEKELEGDAMEGVEEAGPSNTATSSKRVAGQRGDECKEPEHEYQRNGE
ncbi:hypothetical protein J3R82DRAFT_323 [Butyriboletus roseoflavus]|nr:hypothetical protein J3R82DRAFT_323 [Butyriboletus roseoflavus]